MTSNLLLTTYLPSIRNFGSTFSRLRGSVQVDLSTISTFTGIRKNIALVCESLTNSKLQTASIPEQQMEKRDWLIVGRNFSTDFPSETDLIFLVKRTLDGTNTVERILGTEKWKTNEMFYANICSTKMLACSNGRGVALLTGCARRSIYSYS